MGFLRGGEGGVRTHGTVSRTADFKSAALDHSATSPRCDWRASTVSAYAGCFKGLDEVVAILNI